MQFLKKSVLVSLIVLVNVMLVTSVALADLYWETEQVSRGVPGQKESKIITKNYITSHASRTEMGDQVSITDFDKKVTYILDTSKKTYQKIDLAKMGGDQQMQNDPQAQAFMGMMKNMMKQIKVIPTNETKTIAGYKCRKVLVNFMMSENEYWVTKKIKGYKEMQKIAAKAEKVYQSNPMMKNMDISGIIKKIDGFPVRTVTRIMGGEMVSTLKKIKKKKHLPRSLFKVPSGYKLQAE